MESLYVCKVHALDKLEYVHKCDRYVAVLQIHDHPKAELWLSPKQADNLNKSFGGSDYSTKRNTVFAVFAKENGKIRFVWSATNDHGKKFLMKKFEAVDPLAQESAEGSDE